MKNIILTLVLLLSSSAFAGEECQLFVHPELIAISSEDALLSLSKKGYFVNSKQLPEVNDFVLSAKGKMKNVGPVRALAKIRIKPTASIKKVVSIGDIQTYQTIAKSESFFYVDLSEDNSNYSEAFIEGFNKRVMKLPSCSQLSGH